MNLALTGFTRNSIEEKININNDEIIILNLIFKIGRNIKNVKVLSVEGLNVYDILKHQNLALTKSAVAAVTERLG